MKLQLTRIYTCPTYTIGRLRADNVYICDVCEDTDRGLDDSWPLSEIRAKKVMKQTAIPTGTYKVTLGVMSPKMSQISYYKKFCKGYLPRLLNVKGFEGILIHRGNKASQSAGCLLVGYNTEKGRVNNSKHAFEMLYGILKGAHDRGEEIEIEIVRNYKV